MTGFATDPASMIALIDQSIATIVAGMVSETSLTLRQAKMLELSELRRERQYRVSILNQTSPGNALIADVSDYRPDAGPETTNQQLYGPRQ